MISDFPVTEHALFTNLDQKLHTFHRELKFIARTLARLRHRHDATLVFSPGKRHPSQSLLAEVQQRLTGEYDMMLKRLFSVSKKKEMHEDIESAPSTPTSETPPPVTSCIKPASRPPHTRTISEPAPPPVTPTKTRPGHLRSTTCLSASLLETVTLVIDESSQATFTLPRRHLSGILPSHQPETVSILDRDTGAYQPVEAIYLRHIPLAPFTDFLHWTRTGCVLPHPTPTNPPWLLEHHARRLVDALALGVTLNSIDYQCAAINALLALGPLLDHPEDLVNAIFAATAGYAEHDHPARQVIVALVAAKTCGAGKRKVRHGPRDRNVERGDRVESGTFWKMYDAFCEARGPEIGYPRDVEEVLMF